MLTNHFLRSNYFLEPMPEIDEQELKALRDAAARAKELEQEKTEVEGKLKGYEEDASLINWKKSRDTEKRLRTALESQGKKVDEDGNVIDTPTALSADEYRKMAREEAQRELVDTSVAKAKAALNEADRAIFDRYYGKAITGETVDSASVTTFIDLAMKMATENGGMTVSDRATATRGGAPRMDDGVKTDFADTDTGKELAQRLGFETVEKAK